MSDLVWITGAGGLIGNELARSLSRWAPRSSWRARGLTRQDLDLTDHHAVGRLFAREQPALIIHCAAISKSPACEADRPLAWRTNVDATRFLVETASNIPFVFFSTDLVFDGRKGSYTEEDEPNPLMFYGETKLEGERAVREHPEHLILRISLTGGHSPTRNRGFNEEMKQAWREGKTLTLFTDEYRCPIAAEVTARAVWELAAAGRWGTYHLCGAEKLSRFEIGSLLAAHHPEIECEMVASTRASYHGPPRPADTSLATAKIQRNLSFPLPRFSDWLRTDTGGF